jgi:tRNA (uracil-5-)-methyltransferase
VPLSAVEPDRYDALLAEKSAAVSTLLAPFDPPPAEIHASAPTGFRYRAEFRMWHEGDALDYVMFQPESPKTPVPIQDFPVACAAIQSLMPALRDRLRGDAALRRKLFQVEFLSTLAGDTLVTLIYHRPLDDDWETSARQLQTELGIAVVGRSRRQKRVLSRDYVNEVLPVAGRHYHYRQYEQAFSQPNAPLNIRMIEWVLRQAAPLQGDLLELYCGNGNFTLPLASAFDQVLATELSKASSRAARENLAANEVSNVEIVRLAAEEVSQAMAGTRTFRRLAGLPRPLQDYALDTLFVDPPRAGLDPATEAMAAQFDHVIYISCNPQTLASNLRALSRTHRVEAFAQFDQFPYTPHMECGVLLRHRGR